MSITSPPTTPSPLTRAEQDLQYYNDWKQSGESKEHLGKLLKVLQPVIFNEVSRQSGTLPPAALAGQAQKWAIKAIKTYEPGRNVALSTHVTNYLRKIRRLNYTYQNAARIPENLQLKYSEYNTALNKLENMLNREPTDEELASELGWSKPHVVRLKGSLYQDLSESGSSRPTEVSRFNTQTLIMKHITDNLTPEERYFFNNLDKSTKEMCAKLNINQARYSYLKTKLKDKVNDLKREAEAVYL